MQIKMTHVIHHYSIAIFASLSLCYERIFESFFFMTLDRLHSSLAKGDHHHVQHSSATLPAAQR